LPGAGSVLVVKKEPVRRTGVYRQKKSSVYVKYYCEKYDNKN